MANNSFGVNSKIQFGSEQLDDLWLQAQSCVIPSITTTNYEVGGRAGAKIKVSADSVQYGQLQIEAIIDSDWAVYDTIYQRFLGNVNVQEGTFQRPTFDLWLTIMSPDGRKEIRKFWFFNVKLEDIGEVQVMHSNTIDENLLLNLTFTFDYMDLDDSFRKVALD